MGVEVKRSLEVDTLTPSLGTTSGFPADPSEEPGLNHQGNVQSLSLVWQKPQLGSSPRCLEDRENRAANTEWTPYWSRE